MNDSRISVIIPCYNAERSLALCLEGVLTQSLPPLEVIVVDNNSRDRSAAIAEQYASKFPELFTHLQEPRQGPSFARNTGFRHAKGDIIAFTDADCIPDKDWLKGISQSFGLPALVSNRGPFPEAIQNSEQIVDPEDENRVSEKLALFAQDLAVRSRWKEYMTKRANDFSWERSSRKLLEVLKNVKEAKRASDKGKE